MTQDKEATEPPEDRDADKIRRRAYEISQSEMAGTPEENWRRARSKKSAAPVRLRKNACTNAHRDVGAWPERSVHYGVT